MPVDELRTLQREELRMTHWTDELRELHACRCAVQWAAAFETADAAWQQCERGDWMLWCVGKHAGDTPDRSKRLVLCACECARLALPYARDGRTLRCIEVTERWARDEATFAELKAIRQASSSAAVYAVFAAYASSAASYAYAASAYASSAAAAVAAADASTSAVAAVASAVASAASAAAGVDTGVALETRGRCAEIVRQHYPTVESFRGW